MANTAMKPPFDEDGSVEIPLSPAPLVMVVAQLRFPAVVSLTGEKSLAAFQDAIRAEYPIMERQEVHGITITPSGPIPAQPSVSYQFEDLDSAWKVTLGQESLSVQTDQYTNRADFIGRLEQAFNALDKTSAPGPVAVFDRLGVRYVNRLLGDDVKPERLKNLLNESVYGPLVLAESLSDGQELVASVAHQQYRLGQSMLNARWAKLPADAQLTPDIPASPEASWILDIDSSVDTRTPFEPTKTAAVAKRCAEYAYDAFRWIMSEQFIKEREVIL